MSSPQRPSSPLAERLSTATNSSSPARPSEPLEIVEIKREFGRWLIRLAIGQAFFLTVLWMASATVSTLVRHGHPNLALIVALPACAVAGCNLVWLWDHRTWHSVTDENDHSRTLADDVRDGLHDQPRP